MSPGCTVENFAGAAQLATGAANPGLAIIGGDFHEVNFANSFDNKCPYFIIAEAFCFRYES